MQSIIVDCDGVLLNWRDAFNQWLKSHNLITSLEDWELEQYDPPLVKGDVSLSFQLMQIFNQTHFIGKLAPIPGAVDALQTLHRAGHPIRVITAFSNQYESIRLREQNLLNCFGPIFQEINSIPVGKSKVDYLSTQPIDSYFVEDIPKHLNEALEVGLDINNLFLIAQPWNNGKYVANCDLRTNWATISRRIQGN